MRQRSSKDVASLFGVGHLLLDMGPTLRVVCFPSDTPLGKTNSFSFFLKSASGYQFKLASGLEMYPLLLSALRPH